MCGGRACVRQRFGLPGEGTDGNPAIDFRRILEDENIISKPAQSLYTVVGGVVLSGPRQNAPPRIVLKMPRTKNIPRRCEGEDPAVRDQQCAAAALTAAPAPAPHHDALHAKRAGASGVTIKEEEKEEQEEEEEEEEEEETPDDQRRDRLGLAPGVARTPPSGLRTALAAAPAHAPAPHHPAMGGAGASGVTLVKEETEQEETLAQLRDRLGLSARVPAPGMRPTFVHIKVEDSTSGQDTEGEEEDKGWEGEGEEEGEAVREEVEGEYEEEGGGEEEAEEGEDGEVEYRDLPGGGSKRKRAEDTAAPSSKSSPPPPGIRGREVG